MGVVVTPSDVLDHAGVTALDLQRLYLRARFGGVPHAHRGVVRPTQKAARGERTPRKAISLLSVTETAVLWAA